MKSIKYFIQFLIIFILFLVFKVLGLRFASYISGKIISLIGPFFRSKNLINSNILKALPNLNKEEIKRISKVMWHNYGRILAEYMFIKEFRVSKIKNNIEIIGQKKLDIIRDNNEPVIFISGHFNNFELMAMQIDKIGINVAAIYRPLNNIFINIIMEKIRKKYICQNQIQKGIRSIRKLLTMFKNGYSIALMIDQRVSEGAKVNFFGQMAYTTTIPAQFAKKFNCRIVPIYIERLNNDVHFKMKIHEPLSFDKEDSIEKITLRLNEWLEKAILKNKDQWIWTHNRWK